MKDFLKKTSSTERRDYERCLKQRRLWAVGMLIVGLVGFVCYFLLLPDSGLSNYVQGFYLGAASGITGGALVRLVKTQYLLTHPEAQRKSKIKETDEREMQIARTSAQLAGAITVFAAAVASFIVLPFSRDACYTLTGVIMVYILSTLLFRCWLSRKL